MQELCCLVASSAAPEGICFSLPRMLLVLAALPACAVLGHTVPASAQHAELLTQVHLLVQLVLAMNSNSDRSHGEQLVLASKNHTRGIPVATTAEFLSSQHQQKRCATSGYAYLQPGFVWHRQANPSQLASAAAVHWFACGHSTASVLLAYCHDFTPVTRMGTHKPMPRSSVWQLYCGAKLS